MANYDELLKLAADFGSMPTAVTAKVAKVVKKIGFDAQAIMQQEVPVGVTGNLKASVGVEFPDALTAEVGPTVFYAGYVAYGTRHHAPNPYDARTFNKVAPTFDAAIALLGGKVL